MSAECTLGDGLKASMALGCSVCVREREIERRREFHENLPELKKYV